MLDSRPVRVSPPFAVTRPVAAKSRSLAEESDGMSLRHEDYELAARMQLAAPEALDISKEPKHVLRMYGLYP